MNTTKTPAEKKSKEKFSVKVKQFFTKENLFEYLMLSIGSLIMSVAVYFFKMPSHFTMGGFSGISILLAEIFKIDTANLISIMNIASLLIGFIFLGMGVGAKTVYCTLLYTLGLNICEWLYPADRIIDDATGRLALPFTDEMLLELVITCILMAVAAGILFKYGGSSGGTDIIALILRKYTVIDIGVAMMIADGIVVVASFFVFGASVFLCSAIGMVTKNFLIQAVIDAMNRRKSIIIVTSAPEAIIKFITDELHRSATTWHSHGAFTNAEKTTILTNMTTYQASKLREFAKTVDESAFITINKTSEVYGKGFQALGK